MEVDTHCQVVTWHCANQFFEQLPCNVWLIPERRGVQISTESMDIFGHVFGRLLFDVFTEKPKYLGICSMAAWRSDKGACTKSELLTQLRRKKDLLLERSAFSRDMRCGNRNMLSPGNIFRSGKTIFMASKTNAAVVA